MMGVRMMNSLRATREHGLQRLQDFLPRAGLHYAQNRNTDESPQVRMNVSMLSAYLRHRLIHETEVIREVFKIHSIESCQKFVDEVIWRTYWKGYLESRPQIWSAYHNRLSRFTPSERAESGNLLRGKSGLVCFDDWAHELRTTGYLHNHARMWFASIWIFHFGMPWELGAEFFEQFLADGDPASNTLSWRWVAGLHTKGKTYRATAKNISQFTNGRYSESALSINCDRNPQIQTDNLLHDLSAENSLSPLFPSESILKPDSGYPVQLWVHQDDLGLQHPGILENVESAFIWIPSQPTSFLTTAIDDTRQRLEALKVPTAVIETTENLERHLERNRKSTVRSMRSFVGPTRSQEILVNRLCENLQIARSSVETKYDKTLLPLATRGYFPFKQRAWPLLSELTQS